MSNSLKNSSRFVFVAIILIVCAFASANAQLMDSTQFIAMRSSYDPYGNLTPGENDVVMAVAKVVVGPQESMSLDFVEFGVQFIAAPKPPAKNLRVMVNGVQLGNTLNGPNNYADYFWSGGTIFFGLWDQLVIPANSTVDITLMGDVPIDARGSIQFFTKTVAATGMSTYNGYYAWNTTVLHHQRFVSSSGSFTYIYPINRIVAPGSKNFTIPILMYADIPVHGVAFLNSFYRFNNDKLLYPTGRYNGNVFPYGDPWPSPPQPNGGGYSYWDYDYQLNGDASWTLMYTSNDFSGMISLGDMYVGISDNMLPGDSVLFDFVSATVNDTLFPYCGTSWVHIGPQVLFGDPTQDEIIGMNDLAVMLNFKYLYNSSDSLTALKMKLAADVSGDNLIDSWDLYLVRQKYFEPSFIFPIQDSNWGWEHGGVTKPPIQIGSNNIPGGVAFRLLDSSVITNSEMWITIPQGATINAGPGVVNGTFRVDQRDPLTGKARIIFAIDTLTANMGALFTITGASINQVEVEGMMNENQRVIYSTPLGVGDQTQNSVPTEFVLKQNYPNPFNPTTNISFTLPEAGFVTLKVYDLLGQEVATLVHETCEAGEYNIPFDANNLTSGVYTYRLTAGTHIETKKMLLMK